MTAASRSSILKQKKKTPPTTPPRIRKVWQIEVFEKMHSKDLEKMADHKRSLSPGKLKISSKSRAKAYQNASKSQKQLQ